MRLLERESKAHSIIVHVNQQSTSRIVINNDKMSEINNVIEIRAARMSGTHLWLIWSSDSSEWLLS